MQQDTHRRGDGSVGKGERKHISITAPENSRGLQSYASVMVEHTVLVKAVSDAPTLQPLTIFTDSLTSIRNTRGNASETLRGVETTSCQRLQNTVEFLIQKVRPHSGCAGNEPAHSSATGKVTCW
jgi:hypothetical protein